MMTTKQIELKQAKRKIKRQHKAKRKAIIESIIITLVMIAMCIDWDMTLGW